MRPASHYGARGDRGHRYLRLEHDVLMVFKVDPNDPYRRGVVSVRWRTRAPTCMHVRVRVYEHALRGANGQCAGGRAACAVLLGDHGHQLSA